MKKYLINLYEKVLNLFPLKNIVLFESFPDYSDNTKCVFDEMVNRSLNQKYRLIWVFDSKKDYQMLKSYLENNYGVKVILFQSRLYKYYYRIVSKAYIVCNILIEKYSKKQYYCDLAHGCAFKNCAGHYNFPDICKDADVMTISDFMAPYDAKNLGCSVSCMRPLGYARNDDLFNKIDLINCLGISSSINKVIYWMPTYRQHNYSGANYSDISMPIINTSEKANVINECAKDNNTFIVVKVHSAQDLSMVEEYNLSNILFIKNDFFDDKTFTNYQLLGSCDALLTDYSSVYYDYLLCDKPIGLCWEDFDEYKEREGFTVDPDFIMAGGEKIYSTDDLCAFISRVSSDEDLLKEKRNEIKNTVHAHVDNQSTKRIVDYIEQKLSEM